MMQQQQHHHHLLLRIHRLQLLSCLRNNNNNLPYCNDIKNRTSPLLPKLLLLQQQQQQQQQSRHQAYSIYNNYNNNHSNNNTYNHINNYTQKRQRWYIHRSIPQHLSQQHQHQQQQYYYYYYYYYNNRCFSSRSRGDSSRSSSRNSTSSGSSIPRRTISDQEIQQICKKIDTLYADAIERNKELFYSILVTDEDGGQYIDRDRLNGTKNSSVLPPNHPRSEHPSTNSATLAMAAQNALRTLQMEYKQLIHELRNDHTTMDKIIKQYGMAIKQCEVELEMTLYPETEHDRLNNNTLKPSPR